MRDMKNSQSGNVLFYIFIAVALLAALSYVVAQSGRGKADGIISERASAYATEIISYGSVVSQAVDQLRLRGYSQGEVSFENDAVSGYVNGACSDDLCKIFAVDGGAVVYNAPQSAWLDSSQSAQSHYGELYFYAEASAEGVGTSDDDLIMFVPYIRRDICVAINEKLGNMPDTRDVPIETTGPFASGQYFDGAYGTVSDYKVSGDGTAGHSDVLHGQMAGCTESSATASMPPAETYHYYQVLIAR